MLSVPVQLPSKQPRPLLSILKRLGLAAGLIALVAVVVYLGRDGHVDETGTPIGFLDALYYASVTVTTTGYGDITPVTDRARLITTIVVTPARVLFLVLLVGTTLEILTERTRDAVRLKRWKARMRDHYVLCGYGAKGRGATHALLERGVDPGDIVVVDRSQSSTDEASLSGYVAVLGDATRTAVLREAGVERARGVIVAPNSDDTSVLITLTARELNPDVEIVAAVRENENVGLLRQSGANAVITTAEASGRLLGVATYNPRIVDIVEQLLATGQGFDIVERVVSDEEVGRSARDVAANQRVIAIVRDGETLPFTDLRTSSLRSGDLLLSVQADENTNHEHFPLEQEEPE